MNSKLRYLHSRERIPNVHADTYIGPTIASATLEKVGLMDGADPDLATQIIRELKRISPTQEDLGFSAMGGLDLRRLLEALREVPTGVGELGLAQAMARLLQEPDE